MDDNEFRDLQERSALIEEISRQPGWDMLVDRAHATLASVQQSILNGKLDPDDYKSRCGFVEGAFFVLHLPAKVRDELENELELRQEREQAEEELV